MANIDLNLTARVEEIREPYPPVSHPLHFNLAEIRKYTLYEMFEGQRNKSDKYYTIKIPMSEVETAYSNMSSKEWFFSYLNQEMSREVYLSADSM